MQQKAIATIAGQLYDGVVAPGDWHAAMESINQAVGGFKFHQITVNYELGAVVDSVASANEVAAVDLYEKHYALVDERLPVVMKMERGQIMLDHEHFTARDMSRSAIYADWLASQGMRHTMVLMQRVEGPVQEYVGFMRHLDQRAFCDEEHGFARALMPHLVGATRLRAGMKQLAAQAALGMAALDSLPRGVAIVDAKCTVHYLNRAGNHWLAEPGMLGSTGARLHCQDGALDARWKTIVANACAPLGAGVAGTMQLRAGTRTLGLTVLPLRPGHAFSLREEPMALVMMINPDVPGTLSPRLIENMLGLSPAEARMALLLAAGKAVKDFAMAEGCSWHTARTHLKNLMRKTGCHRQMDVAGLIQSLQPG